MTSWNFKDLTGQRFGRYTVLRRDKTVGKTVYWLCKCDCGTIKSVCGSNLRSGAIRSCGCLKREQTVARNYKHGHSYDRLFSVWKGMLTRCGNPNADNYRYYGARGIKVCDEWHEFKPFYDWAMANGYDPNAGKNQCTLDRIDNDGDYSPANCRWSDWQTQCENRRKWWEA